MKILQLSYRLPYPLKDGGAIGIYNLTKAYHQLGHQVTLLSFNTKKHFVADENIPSALTSICNLITVYHNTSLSPIKAFINLIQNKSYHISRFKSNDYKSKLIEILQQNKFDLIHIDGAFMASYVATIKQYSAAKIIVRAHNVEHFIWQKLSTNASFPKSMYLKILAAQMKREEIALWKKVDIVAAINQNELNYIATFVGSEKVKMLAAGIFIDEFKIANSVRIDNSIFYLGSMEWMPNTEAVDWFLKEVWAKVIAQIPDATFYLAGRNMPKRYFNIKIKGIKVIGEVDNATAFMHDKQLMIVPLKSGGGVRIKIVEAMAAANAIVATDLAADGLFTTHQKNIVIANEANDMANKIIAALQNKNTLSALRTEARHHAEQYFDQKKLMQVFLNAIN
ncbi:MAG: hypothetical protein RJA07_2477 [Bacteroidota bacterium]|jgi:glycosyltransferase involved in cell wall biosynthesis